MGFIKDTRYRYMSVYINKSEKLASAVYLITGFFSDLEPIKWKLRTLASDTVSVAISLSTVSVKDKEVMTSELRELILRIGKYFSVAKNAGLVSADNNDLMQEELQKYNNTLGHPTNLTTLFNTELSSPRTNEIENTKETLLIEEKFEPKLQAKPLKVFGAVSVKKNSRQSIIISILKRKKEIMIKDVSSLINGCSEKTIQRELSNMVQSGVLKKIGEKRWSRYFLA